MTDLPPPPDQDPPVPPPAAPGTPAPVPWTPELPGSPTPLSPTLPPTPPGYMVAPPPVSRGPAWLTRRLLIVLGVLAVLVVVAVIGASVVSHNSHYTIVSSSSTDGTFTAGDCVSLSATRVTKSDCGSAHDAQIIQVIHAGQTCPGGTEEFDVNDGTGNLCLDRSNHSSG